MKIPLARQRDVAQELYDGVRLEIWPDAVTEDDIAAIIATLEWLERFRNRVIDLHKKLEYEPTPKELEELRRHPAVAAVLEAYPTAEVSRVTCITSRS